MPVSVRRRALVLLLALGAALALAGAAYAGNGGFAPATPHSPNASGINDSYKLIALFTGIIFVIVEGALIWFIFRYRNRGRPRTAEGPQIYAHTRLELMWTAEGRGRETYEALAPEKVSYTQFVTRATQVVVRGLAEGWIQVDLPVAPTADDSQYRVRFVDAERWADELTAAFSVNLPADGRSEVEGDPDLA